MPSLPARCARLPRVRSSRFSPPAEAALAHPALAMAATAARTVEARLAAAGGRHRPGWVAGQTPPATTQRPRKRAVQSEVFAPVAAARRRAAATSLLFGDRASIAWALRRFAP